MEKYGNIQITPQQYQAMQNAYNNGNYTQYHFLKSQYGSTIAKLYIPGPTGFGFFWKPFPFIYTGLHRN
jgi:hypothetical protein